MARAAPARDGGRAFMGAAAGWAAGWAVLVAAGPRWFLAAAAPWCAVWMALSALAASPGLRARLAPRAVDVALGLAAAAALYGAARAFLWAFCGGLSHALCGPTSEILARFGTRGSAPAALVLGALVAPAEELFWRGAVQARLEAWLGRGAGVAGLRPGATGALAALATAAIASAVALATGQAFLALATFPTYVAWGLLAAWRKSLVPAIASHAVWTVLVAVLLPPT